MLAALPGALYTWQSDVLGRPNITVPEALQRDSTAGKRDGGRVPMQWNMSENGGFSRADTEQLWLPAVDPAVYRADNIEIQGRDPRSPYRLVKEILRRRKNDPALRMGSLRMLQTDHANVLAFARADPQDLRRQVISVTNFSQDTIPVSILDARQMGGRVTLSSSNGHEREDTTTSLTKPIILPPDQSYVVDSAP
jgi:maltose alpha-D-glucosyltransferase/alpha-amylase